MRRNASDTLQSHAGYPASRRLRPPRRIEKLSTWIPGSRSAAVIHRSAPSHYAATESRRPSLSDPPAGSHVLVDAQNAGRLGVSQFAEAGGLLAYGPSLAAGFRRAPTYVDKILKGATPADLPVEQPTKFELIINLKTAKALGLTIPPTLLFQADEVIR
jgi:hypothetical protein